MHVRRVDMKKKITMVTINGQTKFLMLPVCKDGKVRCDIKSVFKIARDTCITIGAQGSK